MISRLYSFVHLVNIDYRCHLLNYLSFTRTHWQQTKMNTSMTRGHEKQIKLFKWHETYFTQKLLYRRKCSALFSLCCLWVCMHASWVKNVHHIFFFLTLKMYSEHCMIWCSSLSFSFFLFLSALFCALCLRTRLNHKCSHKCSHLKDARLECFKGPLFLLEKREADKESVKLIPTIPVKLWRWVWSGMAKAIKIIFFFFLLLTPGEKDASEKTLEKCWPKYLHRFFTSLSVKLPFSSDEWWNKITLLRYCARNHYNWKRKTLPHPKSILSSIQYITQLNSPSKTTN